MIQRIQTVYLMAIVVLQTLALQFSYLNFEKNGKLFELHSTGIIAIKSKIQFHQLDILLLLTGIIAIILVTIIIFLFKKRYSHSR